MYIVHSLLQCVHIDCNQLFLHISMLFGDTPESHRCHLNVVLIIVFTYCMSGVSSNNLCECVIQLGYIHYTCCTLYMLYITCQQFQRTLIYAVSATILSVQYWNYAKESVLLVYVIKVYFSHSTNLPLSRIKPSKL